MDINKVDTRHGTFNREEFSNGNTLPYTGVPFGMNYFSVQNQNKSNWYFDPTLPLFQGVRLTHQPSPWMGDYCSILLSPITGTPKVSDPEVNQSSYNIKESKFKPHYLSMYLYRYELELTLVPSNRAAKIKIKKNTKENFGLLLNVDDNAEVLLDKKINKLFVKMSHTVNSGKSNIDFYTTYDFGNLDIELLKFNLEGDLVPVLPNNSSDVGSAFFVKFSSNQDEIDFSMGTSFISKDLAINNLEKEVSNKNINELIKENEEKWNRLLNKIEVSDRNKQKVDDFNFYLYRVFLFPQTFYEIDHNETPVHYDVYNKSVKKGKFFTNIGFWDAYRTIFPLYSIILPEFYKDVLEGIYSFYESTSHLPKWLSPDERGLMPGTHVSAVIADAASKGLLDKKQIELFMNAMIKEAEVESDDIHFGRRGILDTEKYGYVTITEEGSVNQTLDNSYSDFCISQLAKLINDDENQRKYQEKSLNYRNLFDVKSGFLRGKDEKGDFVEPFSPNDWSREYIEASPWVTSLGAFHNITDYNNLFGGEEEFSKHLIELSNSNPAYTLSKDGMEYNEVTELATSGFGQIAISNQPGFHIPYLFTFIGKPEYTQLIVRQICEQLFSTKIDGYPGDEDNGSLSGWYIFSSIGFYPVTPGVDQYVLGMPQFDEVRINLPDGNIFTISTSNHNIQNQFIKNVKLNGNDYDLLYLNHDTILKGGNLHFDLRLLPNEKKYTINQLPYSLSTVL